jgi:hypothetical protein
MSDSTTVDLTESRATAIYLVAWLFTGIAIVTVILKLFARSRITKQLGWDDFFIFFSLVRIRSPFFRSDGPEVADMTR